MILIFIGLPIAKMFLGHPLHTDASCTCVGSTNMVRTMLEQYERYRTPRQQMMVPKWSFSLELRVLNFS